MVTDQEVFDRWPNVYLSFDNLEHYRGLLEKRLLIKKCQSCGYWVYPHFPRCPDCWSADLTFTEVSGKGRVYLLTVFHQVRPYPGDPHSSVLPLPYPGAAVELVEQKGLRYAAPIVGIDPSRITMDMPVELTWIEGADVPKPAFRPAGRS